MMLEELGEPEEQADPGSAKKPYAADAPLKQTTAPNEAAETGQTRWIEQAEPTGQTGCGRSRRLQRLAWRCHREGAQVGKGVVPHCCVIRSANVSRETIVSHQGEEREKRGEILRNL